MKLLAKDHNLFLGEAADALKAISSALSVCIFTEADLSNDFFDLNNGLAGEVFQKFANYQFHAAFVIPTHHKYGARVSELIKDHKRHSAIRFFNTVEEAAEWLNGISA